MKTKLARVLIERRVIQHGSVFEAYYNARGISCQCDSAVLGAFKLIGAKATKDWVFFETLGPDQARYMLRCDYIISLDGMPLSRIAESHQLTEDGEEAKPNRRGRRKRLDEAPDQDLDFSEASQSL
jgi:hypothetical protein